MARSGNPWMAHLAAFWKKKKSTGISYRKAMKEAKKSYTKKHRGGSKSGALGYSELASTTFHSSNQRRQKKNSQTPIPQTPFPETVNLINIINY